MVELFNPAGLRILEDRQGAVAYGYLAPRVLYARIVGRLSAELGESYVDELENATGEGPLAYFADESALYGAHPLARRRFRAFVANERRRFSSIVMLRWGPVGPAWVRGFRRLKGGSPIEIVDEPIEFERALCNVTTFPDRRAKDFAHVWQLHTPRRLPVSRRQSE